jgi:hypothetical protein
MPRNSPSRGVLVSTARLRSGDRMSPVRRLVVMLSVLALCGDAHATFGAGSWHCGGRLVGPGAPIEDVYALCGDPTFRAASTEFVTRHFRCGVDVTRPVLIEQWTYNPGPQQFVRVLTFCDGTLLDIVEGSYGY